MWRRCKICECSSQECFKFSAFDLRKALHDHRLRRGVSELPFIVSSLHRYKWPDSSCYKASSHRNSPNSSSSFRLHYIKSSCKMVINTERFSTFLRKIWWCRISPYLWCLQQAPKTVYQNINLSSYQERQWVTLSGNGEWEENRDVCG